MFNKVKTKSLLDISSPKQWKTISMDMLTKEGYPVYGANGVIGKYSEYNHKERTLLITCRGATCGSLNICEPYSYVTGNSMAIENLDPEVKIDYLFYFLKFRGFSDIITGSAQPQIIRSALGNIFVTYPELSEQQKIVATLDQVNNLISLRNQQLEQLDLLVKSRFVEMFGDPVINPFNIPIKKLSELTELITKGASPGWQGFSYTDDETQTLFVTSENVREGYLDLTEKKYIEDGFNQKQKRSMLKRGDFLITLVGASIGRAAYYNVDLKANINQAVALVRLNSKEIIPNYLLHYLNSPKALEMYESMKSSTARANLSLIDINNLQILTPKVHEQEKFSDFLKQVEQNKATVKQNLDWLNTLKAKLMQDFFG